jgi:hypothetical protein
MSDDFNWKSVDHRNRILVLLESAKINSPKLRNHKKKRFHGWCEEEEQEEQEEEYGDERRRMRRSRRRRMRSSTRSSTRKWRRTRRAHSLDRRYRALQAP